MKSSDGPLDNQTWSKSSLPQQKLPKSLYSHICTLANGSQSSTIFQVWLFSGPEFFTLAILCMIVKLGIGTMYSGYHLWGYTRGSQYHTTQSHICISVYSSTPPSQLSDACILWWVALNQKWSPYLKWSQSASQMSPHSSRNAFTPYKKEKQPNRIIWRLFNLVFKNNFSEKQDPLMNFLKSMI